MDKGFVYILTNPSFREDWVKIGKSKRPVDVRSKELDNTAVPLPFEIYATIETAKFNEVEKNVHKMIDRLTDLRIRQNREFFNVEPSVALGILKEIATLLDDAVVCEYHDGKPVVINHKEKENAASDKDRKSEKRKQSAPFKFSYAGLKPGETIHFEPANIDVIVNDDKMVEYEGRLYSLSGFTKNFMPLEMQNTSHAYQGPKYFTHEGKTLNDLRIERDKQGLNHY